MPSSSDKADNYKAGTTTPAANVLVVDDIPENIHLLAGILAHKQYKVRPATSGHRALEYARSNPPDIILLDIKMPGMDGYEVCKELKADSHTRDIPVIFISALGEHGDKIKAFSSGGVDYITKPFQEEEVLFRIQTHLDMQQLKQRLEEDNKALQREIAERHQAQQALQSSEYRFRQLFNNAPLGILSVDRTGKILEVNEVLLELMGSPSETATRAINVLSFPPLVEAGISGDIRHCFETGEPVRAERYYRSNWGVENFLRIYMAPLYSKEKTKAPEMVEIILEDITQSREAEKALSESETRLRSVIQNIPVILWAVDHHGEIFLSEGKSLSLLGLTAGELVGQNIKQVYAEYPESMDGVERALRGEISTLTTTISGITFENYYEQIRDENERVTGLLGISIDVTERRHAELALKTSETKFRSLVDNSPDIIMIVDSEGVIMFINNVEPPDTRQDVLGSRVYRYLPERIHDEYRNKLKRVFVEGESLQLEVPARDDITYLSRFVPIYYGEIVISAMIVATDITERKRAEVAVARARDAMKARIDELSSLNFIMQTVSSVTTVINLSTVLEIISERITQTFNAQGAFISLLNEGNTELKVLAHFSNNPAIPDLPGYSLSLAESSFASEVVEKRKPLVIPRPKQNPMTRSIHVLMWAQDTECLMCVPLRARGGVIGMITVDINQKDREFTQEEVNLAETISGQIAGAIENARLFEEEQKSHIALFKANRRLQEDLSLAQEIQFTLLPQEKPPWQELDVLCFMTPARQLGGDFYSYYSYGNRRFALCVGDVSGKGVSASLLMATSLSQLDASYRESFAPAELLNYLDKVFMPYTRPRGRNCAVSYAEVELYEGVSGEDESARESKQDPTPVGVIKVANAGCVPPYIRRSDGRVDWPEIGGIPLGQGLGSRIGYNQVELQLFKGDHIIIISDGIVESINEAGDMLGFDAFRELLSRSPARGAEEMMNYIKDSLAEYVGEADRYDDLTIIVARV